MLTLYYGPGACSMAAHIVLEESGESYEPRKVDLAGGEQRSEDYQGQSARPRAGAPARRRRAVRENTAILPYLGKRFEMWPNEPKAELKAMSLIGWFASSVHPAHAHVGRPERYTAEPAPIPDQGSGPQDLPRISQGDRWHAGRAPIAVDNYSVLDPYAFVFYTWGVRRELPMDKLKNYTAHKDRMLERPAVDASSRTRR